MRSRPSNSTFQDSSRRPPAVRALLGLLLLGVAARAHAADLPARLSETGLYADAALRSVAPENLPFTPQYALWSDGAAKRRWIHLPAGSAIDASDVDVWSFPIGTKFWKEFSFGRPVETRYMERGADGSWRFATYRWREDGSDADLVPPSGARSLFELRPGVSYDAPGEWDCRACHEGRPTPVLGFSALQLSRDRDPLALHREEPSPGSVDLGTLVASGRIRGIPAGLVASPPRIEASDPVSRAAQGYLHANCGHCHNSRGPLAELGLDFAVELAPAHDATATLRSAVGVASRFRNASGESAPRIAAGDPSHSLVVERLSSRQPLLQMPPLGSHLVDEEAVELVSAWIRGIAAPRPVAADRASMR